MPYIEDRTQETTTTTGTGSYTLDGAQTGYQTFAAAFGSAPAVVIYAVSDGTDWEVGEGTFNGTTGLTRDHIRSSSNSGNAVDWGAGTKDIWCDANAALIRNSMLGRQYARICGGDLP